MGSKDPVLLLRLQAAYENGERQRTSVKRWMTDNYEDFSAKLDEMFPNGRVNWIWLTAWFQENGFRNRDGSDLKKHTVRANWRRVIEDRAKKRPSRTRQVREIGEAATAGRNDLFRAPVSPERMPQPVVRVEQPVSRSVPQAQLAEAVHGSSEGMSAEDALAAMMVEINKRSGR
jgi:hypothetical protein